MRTTFATLREGSFVNRAINVIAFRQPGHGQDSPAGRSRTRTGAVARTVLFAPAFQIVQRLLAAKRDLRLGPELRKLDRFEASSSTTSATCSRTARKMEVLFTLLAERYERRSMLITSNLVFSKWDQIFKDTMTTAAAVDRVVHHSVILGEAVRLVRYTSCLNIGLLTSVRHGSHTGSKEHAVKKLVEPFGDIANEYEVARLGAKWHDFYFDRTSFAERGSDEGVYLIVGRRGSGKTALLRHLSLQHTSRPPLCVEIFDQEYQAALSRVAARIPDVAPLAIPELTKVWGIAVWSTILPAVAEAGVSVDLPPGVEAFAAPHSERLADALVRLLRIVSPASSSSMDSGLDATLAQLTSPTNIAAVTNYTSGTRAIVVAIDSSEAYDISDDAVMKALAALVHFAATFNHRYARNGLHLKVVVSGEVFSFLSEAVILNPLKVVRYPLYLIWRPKELLRLICWRLVRSLVADGTLSASFAGDIPWDRPEHVMRRVWAPFFGTNVSNDLGVSEATFPYILRHTQMTPRHLIALCNRIAQRTLEASGPLRTLVQGRPYCDPRYIAEALREYSLVFPAEVLNSYRALQPGLSQILDALIGLPMLFPGTELDRRAKMSAGSWLPNSYSVANFRQLVVQLGVVGRVTRRSSRYVDAEFEYARPERLYVTHRDECVIHPMFHRRLNTDLTQRLQIMPFAVERGEVDEELRELS